MPQSQILNDDLMKKRFEEVEEGKVEMIKEYLQGREKGQGQDCLKNGFIEDSHVDGFRALQVMVINTFMKDAEHVQEHVKGLDLLEDLSFTYICLALFVELGWRPSPGDLVSSTSFIQEFHTLRGQKRFVDTLLRRLGERGFLSPRVGGKGWEVNVAPPTVIFIEDELKRLQVTLHNFPIIAQEVAFCNYIGSHLGSFLQGRESGLQILFPDEGSPNYSFGAKAFYEKTFIMAHCKVNPTKVGLGSHFQCLFNNNQGHPIRVLEIGGGTGGTTVPTLEYLSSLFEGNLDFLHYTFTDISNFFVGKAKGDLTTKFPGVKFDFRILDIEIPPQGQGFGGGEGEEQGFDVIIAADILHATEFLNDSLVHTRSLLKDKSGVLVLGEVFQSKMLIEMSFGLTEGWWRWGDGLRTHGSPCLTPGEWEVALRRSGFRESWAVGDETYGIIFALAE